MANFHVQGIDGIAKGLELLGQKTGPMAEDMLHAGALILIGTWNRVIIARGHVETGAMPVSYTHLTLPTKLEV